VIRPSDLLALDSPERSSELLSSEFSAWCSAVAQLWEADDRLKDDFANVGEFFNWAFAIAEKILRSVK
jgi:hypothetical protein